MRNVEAEMIRSHELCLKISARKPTDPDYKGLLEELFQCALDDSVVVVSPFYCDCGCRMTFGKNVTINKGATILSPGRVVIEDNVLIGPEVKIVTVDHDLYDRHDLFHFGQVTIKENAWICIGAIICPGVTIGRNAVVAAGAVRWCRSHQGCPRQRSSRWQSRQNHQNPLTIVGIIYTQKQKAPLLFSSYLYFHKYCLTMAKIQTYFDTAKLIKN